MNKEQFNEFKRTYDEFAKEAEAHLIEYCEITNQTHKRSYVELIGFDGDSIIFEGDEYWSYGGHEHHYIEMPNQFVYDKEFRKEFRKKEELREKQKALQEEEAKLKRKEQFLKLQQEFTEND